jgi:arginine/lysine/ornithine decarboxylase
VSRPAPGFGADRGKGLGLEILPCGEYTAPRRKDRSSASPPMPRLAMTPRQAWFAELEDVPFNSARGRVSAELVVPYPPGTPVLCPGEVVTDEVYDYLAEQKAKGRHLHCAAGDSIETLSVVK